MGKRSGEFVTLREIVDEVGARRHALLPPDAQIGRAARFDLDLAKERSAENPVFYVQYAHARVASVFRAAEAMGLDRASARRATDAPHRGRRAGAHPPRRAVPGGRRGAALELEPHRVVFFLMELAADFHRYYNRTRILGDDRELAAARLLLVANVQKTIRAGLGILGIAAPDTM